MDDSPKQGYVGLYGMGVFHQLALQMQIKPSYRLS